MFAAALDRRSTCDRLSPVNCRSSAECVSTPLRRSTPDLLTRNRSLLNLITIAPGLDIFQVRTLVKRRRIGALGSSGSMDA
jgi:hypothetical protein